MAVGRRFINKVMEEVLTKFQPGVLPHYFVVQTFANLSVTNGAWLCSWQPAFWEQRGQQMGLELRFGRGEIQTPPGWPPMLSTFLGLGRLEAELLSWDLHRAGLEEKGVQAKC